nr:BON domain-containing protein [uncultured Devosia sp.]
MIWRKECRFVRGQSVAVAKELEMAMTATGVFAAASRPGRARIDDNIAERVTQALWANPFLDPSNIAVAVEASRVVLRGVVDTDEEIDLATAILQDLYCCDDVVNDLRIARGLDVVLPAAA